MKHIRIILPAVVIVAIVFAIGSAGIAVYNNSRPHPPANILPIPSAPLSYPVISPHPAVPPNTLGRVPSAPPPLAAAAAKAFLSHQY